MLVGLLLAQNKRTKGIARSHTFFGTFLDRLSVAVKLSGRQPLAAAGRHVLAHLPRRLPFHCGGGPDDRVGRRVAFPRQGRLEGRKGEREGGRADE